MSKLLKNAIFAGIGGFFSANDGNRHVIVMTTAGKLFEIFYGKPGKGTSYLACFDSVLALDAFFSPNDKTSHAIVATPDGNISEIYYLTSGIFFSAPPLANFASIIAISSFFTPDDKVGHVIVATADGNITEVFYGSSIGSHVTQPPLAKFANIVAISAFYSDDDKNSHVIVATADGNITEVYYGKTIGVHISQPALAKFSEIVDIGAFYSPNDKVRHVIVATADGNLTEVFYGPGIGVHVSQPPLANLKGIVGITSFFTSDDTTGHVIVATEDGNVTEVYYGSKIGSHVSAPALGTFGIESPALEDISPDLSNLDPGAKNVVSVANGASIAGRSISIVGHDGNLFVFNEKAGVWKYSTGPNWLQLPESPLHADRGPPSFLALDPNNSGDVVAVNDTGAFETTDGGTTWKQIAQTWSCGSPAVRAVVFASNSALILATDCGIATRSAVGQVFTFFSSSAGITALALGETKVWARTASNLYVSTDHGTTWTTVLTADKTLAAQDSSTLAAFDDFVYFASASPNPTPPPANNNILAVFDVAAGTFSTQIVSAHNVQTGDGTGLGGRRFVRTFIRSDSTLTDSLGPGGRRQLFMGVGQEIWQALGATASGSVTDWNLVIATTASGAVTSTGASPPMRIHADIWDFLIDTNAGAKKAWVAGDGGIYEIDLASPFTFPESKGWIQLYGGMHTHQAHMINVVPINPVNRSRLAYPTADNEGWYQDYSAVLLPRAPWQITSGQPSATWTGSSTGFYNLGDASWTNADLNNPDYLFMPRHQEIAMLVRYSETGKNRVFVKFLNYWVVNNKVVLAGHVCPGAPTAFQFIPSPKSAGALTTLDAVMMCDLPLLKAVASGATTNVSSPFFSSDQPLGQNTNGAPVLIRNKNFETNADINANNAKGWAVEISSLPSGTAGFYVTGGRQNPIYYAYTGDTLYRFSSGSWNAVAQNLVWSAAFGPAFVNPYDSNMIFALTNTTIQVSSDGGKTFPTEAQLTSLVRGSSNLPMSSLAQIGFNYDNPAEIVVGAQTGLFFRSAAGRWANLTALLPKPLALITGVGIDSEALYVSFDSRSIVRVTGYRAA
jgi:hypothetical protein